MKPKIVFAFCVLLFVVAVVDLSCGSVSTYNCVVTGKAYKPDDQITTFTTYFNSDGTFQMIPVASGTPEDWIVNVSGECVGSASISKAEWLNSEAGTRVRVFVRKGKFTNWRVSTTATKIP